MPIDFHAPHNRFSYAMREADLTWRENIQHHVIDVRGKTLVDIGCGGGIYTLALAEMGAAQVTGVDFSREEILAAQEMHQDVSNVTFTVGDAFHTGLASGQYDIVLERALIHHFKQEDLPRCFIEASRILKPGGMLIVQNRTPEDCMLPGSETHVRYYIVSQYPELLEKDVARRHTSAVVIAALQQAGFVHVEEQKLWETRQIYKNVDELTQDIQARTGRSILHELSDEKLQRLVDTMRERLKNHKGVIVEQDRWTVWSAIKTRA